MLESSGPGLRDYLATGDMGEEVITDMKEEMIVGSGNNDELEMKIQTMFSKDSDGLYHCNVCGKSNKQKPHMKNHVDTHIVGHMHSCP